MTLQRWQLRDVHLHLTDRRVIFLSTAFDPGGGWVGFGGVGLVAAAAATVVSKRRARERSAGKLAIGHVRYEWLNGALVQTKKALIGVVDRYPHLVVCTSSGPLIVELWNNKVVTEEFAWGVARGAIDLRLALGQHLTADQKDALARRRSGERVDLSSITHHAGDKGWLFGGDVVAMVALVAADVRGAPNPEPRRTGDGLPAGPRWHARGKVWTAPTRERFRVADRHKSRRAGKAHVVSDRRGSIPSRTGLQIH